jgi:hypothetical protein
VVANAPSQTFGYVFYSTAMVDPDPSKHRKAPARTLKVRRQRSVTVEEMNEVIADSWAAAGATGLDPKPKPKS